MVVPIDKNIPVPVNDGLGAKQRKYPFAEMEIGDSFFIPSTGYHDRLRKARSLNAQFRRFKPKRFALRSVDDGVRVWRIE